MYVQTLKKLQTPYTPGVIGTEIIGKSIFEYAKISRNIEKYEGVLKSIRDFFIKKQLVKYNTIHFIKYKPSTPEYSFTYNASIVAAVFVLQINNYFNEDVGNNGAIKCVKDVINQQKKDGSWNYSINLTNKSEKEQIDFHQGFILVALMDYLKFFPQDYEAVKALELGLNYYATYQFDDHGMCYYRYPRKWPANIHNQAQGIITFAKAAQFNINWTDKLENILGWTFNNMYNIKKSYFYFLKYPLFTNKIPYIRWNQAFMFRALSHIINYK